MDSSVPPTARSVLKHYLADALLLAVLLALTLKFGYDIAAVRDLGTDDETNYLAHGHYLSKWGQGDACYGPLYIHWYHVWAQFNLDPTFVYYANWKLLIFLLAASVYVLVRVLGGFRVGAIAVAFLTMTSGISEIWPYPMHLATFVLAIGAATAARLRSWPWSLLAIGASLAVTSFLRPEFTFALLLFCPVALVCAGWIAFRRPDLRLRMLAAVLLMAALTGGLFHSFGNPLAGGRSFLAFGQHYSLNAWVQHRTEVDPWTNWERITRADFGDADSVQQAIRNNPKAFAGHLWFNILSISKPLDDLTTPLLELGFRTQIAFRVVVLIFAVAGLVGFVLRLFRPSSAGDPANRSLRIVLGMFFFIAAPTGAAVVVIYPRLHYLLPLVVFCSALAFSGYRGFPRVMARLHWLEAWPVLVAFAVLLIAVTPNRVHRWSVQQCLRSEWTPAKPVLDVQRTVAFMRGLHVHSITPPHVLESDFSRAFYAGWDFEEVSHWTKTERFWPFMASHNISVVVLNERLLADTRFRDDPGFQAFAAEKKVRRFQFFAVPDTTVRVAVREDLLPDLAPRLCMVRDLLQDREYETGFIIKNYQHYLSRTPNGAEVASWINRGSHELSAVSVQAQFLSSQEFCGRAGYTDQAWVDAVYRELLGRTAEYAEQSHCLQQLTDGVSRYNIVLGIAVTQERLSRHVQSYYQQYLGRTGSTADITDWVNDMQEGATDEELLADILSSAEFYRLAGNTDEAWVEALYLNLFNRPATAEEEGRSLQRLAATGQAACVK